MLPMVLYLTIGIISDWGNPLLIHLGALDTYYKMPGL